MEVLEAIRKRRAVRNFKPLAVDPSLLRKLIDSANWAPSAMNGQPWHFIVITDPALLEKIATEARKWCVANASELGADARMHALLSDRTYNILHHAPALILVAATTGVRWGTESCAVAAENIMLAATELELGSCWIGLAEGWLNTPEGHALLELSGGERIHACLVVGHPKGSVAPPSRRQPTITWIAGRDERYVENESSAWPVSSGLYGSLLTP